MSKAIVDGIIRSSLNRREKRFDSLARKYSARSNPHLHTISYEDIRKTIVANFSIAMKKVTAENYEENPKVQQFLEKVARKTFNTYASKYMLGKGDTIQQYTDYIKIYQPKLNDKALKAPIFSTAIPLLEKGFSKTINGSEEFKKSFTRATQFLHIGNETAGTEGLRILGNTVDGQAPKGDGEGPKKIRQSEVSNETIEKNIDKKLKEAGVSLDFSTAQAREAGTNVIIDMLRRLEIDWKSKEKQLSNEYSKNITVYGTIGSSKYNRPGSESYDWKNLRAQMEDEITKALFGDAEDFGNKAASMSPVEKIKRLATNQVIDAVMKASNKNFKVTAKREKVQKKKKDTSKVGRVSRKATKEKSNSTVNVGRAIAAGAGAATKKNSAPRSNLLRLQGLLNTKLSGDIRKNMKAPALVNRSGDFASSVRVTEITTTAKGFPSIGYTYDKNPYQVFELGAGTVPWATEQRDPRKLISKSIREIAREMLVGRFFTRRV